MDKRGRAPLSTVNPPVTENIAYNAVESKPEYEATYELAENIAYNAVESNMATYEIAENIAYNAVESEPGYEGCL